MRAVDYAGVDLLAALLSAVAAGVAWRRQPAPGSTAFVVLTGAAAWWCAWSAVNQLAPDLPTKFAAIRLSWIGAATAPTAYLVVALQYVGHESQLRRRTVALLAVEPLATILMVWTNDLHGLMWTAIRLDERGPVPFFDATHGPWFWAHDFYAILLAVTTAARLGQVLFGSPHRLYRNQAGLLLAGLFVVVLSNFLYLANQSPIGGDITPAAFALGAAALTGGLLRRQLFDVTPLAHAAVLEGIRDGIVVLDRSGRVTELNLAARELLGGGPAVGRPLATTAPDLAEWLARATPDGIPGEVVLATSGGRLRSLEVRPSVLCDRDGREVGQAVVLVDMTERRRVGELERSRDLIIAAEENLRREIAEQLHAGVQTKLLLAWYRLNTARGDLVADPSGAAASLAMVSEELDTIREHDVRQVSHRLHPAVIRVGLVPAVRALVDRHAGPPRVELQANNRLIEVDDPGDNKLPEPLRLAVYRLVEEALANVHRHARAERATVELSMLTDSTIEVVVRDDGCGFVLGQEVPGLGFNAIAARVATLGGHWQVESAVGQGTSIIARLPLETTEPASQPSSWRLASERL